MKDGEILALMSSKWMSVNKIKEACGLHWNKLMAQLSGLENKGLVERIEFQKKNRVFRYFRKPTVDDHTLSIIERTKIEDRSNKDHQYIIRFKYNLDVKKYIDEILRSLNETK